MLGLILCALSVIPTESVHREFVDLIELNHYYDSEGKHVFDQLIFYDWCNRKERYQVRDWRLVKEPCMVPVNKRCLWRDNGVLYSIHGKIVRESWEQHDPELEERKHLSKENRKEIGKPPSVRWIFSNWQDSLRKE